MVVSTSCHPTSASARALDVLNETAASPSLAHEANLPDSVVATIAPLYLFFHSTMSSFKGKDTSQTMLPICHIFSDDVFCHRKLDWSTHVTTFCLRSRLF